MNQTRNLIFAFLGGMTVGSAATAVIMKHLAKTNPSLIQDAEDEFADEEADSGDINDKPQRDKPSFDMGKTLNTHKFAYDGVVNKPDLEEVVAKYADEVVSTVEQEAAEREYPEEDEPDGDEMEIAEALMDHPGQTEDLDNDGIGTVLRELRSVRKDNALYLIPEDCLGEIFAEEHLIYYTKDNVLTDAFDGVVDDVDRLIGDALEHFGECGDEENAVYVRNLTTETEYAVELVDGYFSAHLYGIDDSEFEGGSMAKIPRKAGRKKADGGEGYEDRE